MELYNPQTLNPYVYCLNNPLTYVDPDGENAKSAVTIALTHDLSVPDPTDVAVVKWVGWAVAFGGVAIIDEVVPNPVEGSLQNAKEQAENAEDESVISSTSEFAANNERYPGEINAKQEARFRKEQPKKADPKKNKAPTKDKIITEPEPKDIPLWVPILKLIDAVSGWFK